MAAAPPTLLAAAAGGGALLLRQLFDADTGTYTYLIADVASSQGVLIDPVYEQHSRDRSLIRELGIALVASLDTHAHADHITGSWLMHRATGCAIGLAAVIGAENVSLPLRHGERVGFGGRHLQVRATPGHTDGCLSFVLDDASLAFSGDALLVRGCGRCDFQQGDARTLYRSIQEQILSLPPSCLLYPGHDYAGRAVSSVAEEKAFNARLGGAANARDFVIYMESLRLPHPGRLAEALPANLRCGRPLAAADDAAAVPVEAVWAPLQHSYAGLPELHADWLVEHREAVTLLDVRSSEEFHGPDGHLAGSLLIPLPELPQRLGEIPGERPVVVLCHSGSRSALATQQLQRAGLRVANLHGGLRHWEAEGFPLQRSGSGGT
ncbi:MAG: rhodanese-like domain-containing protein [Synechococcaceae cyanobacterium]|nr:rhodanese-like domain-containing protein [Synechococcaceae cyanobacterium]